MTILFRCQLLAVFSLALTLTAQGKDADWTVFQLPPCALADLKVTDGKAINLRARGQNQPLTAQGGEPGGCGIPANAQALLVDLLLDTTSERALMSGQRKAASSRTLLKTKRGFTAQSAVLEMCAGRRCVADVSLAGLEKGDRMRVFVRGYLMKGPRYASTQLIDALLARDLQRVIDCEVWHGPNGEIYRIGTDCGLDYSGVPRGNTNGDQPDADDDDSPTGCPYDYFDEDEWTTEQTRFRFPVAPAEWIVPTAIHMDHDRTPAANELICQPWFPGVLCYDNHEGSDFSLIGGFWKQDDKSVYAVAAADGVVMSTREDRFDRCQADIAPFDCSAQICQTVYGVTVCSPCAPNLNFGQPFCQEGDEPRDYDGLQANHVRVCHADGTISRYLHLMRNEVAVEPGDEVECGEQLGLIGSSGRSSAPHLHFDVVREGVDEWVDPFDAGSGESLWVEPALPGLLPGTACQ